MIDIRQMVRHSFWKSGREGVQNYLKALRESEKEIEKIGYAARRVMGLSDDRIKEISKAIKDEIKLCEHYFETEKKMKLKGFKSWEFVKQENGTDDYSHMKPSGDFFEWFNGKIRAQIILDRSGKLVRVSLRIKNDSDHEQFASEKYWKEHAYTHLKSEESIAAKIDEYKAYALHIADRCRYPHYSEARNIFNRLNVLTHNEEISEEA